MLILYTDGLTEASNASGATFGLAQLQQSITRALNSPARDIQQSILDEVHQFLQGQALQDDVTLLVIKYN